jgi:glycopeptide antibiotics resistance protein
VIQGSVVVWAAAPLVAILLVTRPSPLRLLVGLVAIGHVLILASVALFPIPADPTLRGVAPGAPFSWIGLNLIPFATIGPSIVHGLTGELRIAVLNLFVLFPSGLYLPILFPVLRSGRALVAVAVLGGLSVEVLQLLISLRLGFLYRTVDIDDAILNTAGLVLGLLVARLALARWPALR